jgi:hypothetical protein
MKTPELTFGHLLLFNAMLPNLRFENSSWGNDATDSIMSGDELIQIYLPNVFDPYKELDHEEFRDFSFKMRMTENDDFTDIGQTFSLYEILFVLSKLDNVFFFEGDGHELKELLITDGECWEDIIVPQLKMEIGDKINIGTNLDVERIS